MKKAMLIGNACADAEIRELKKGTKVANFTLAVNDSYKKEETMFLHITAFAGLADICEKCIKKGVPTYVEGEIKPDNYTNKNGEKVFSFTIKANTVRVFPKSDGFENITDEDLEAVE